MNKIAKRILSIAILVYVGTYVVLPLTFIGGIVLYSISLETDYFSSWEPSTKYTCNDRNGFAYFKDKCLNIPYVTKNYGVFPKEENFKFCGSFVNKSEEIIFPFTTEINGQYSLKIYSARTISTFIPELIYEDDSIEGRLVSFSGFDQYIHFFKETNEYAFSYDIEDGIKIILPIGTSDNLFELYLTSNGETKKRCYELGTRISLTYGDETKMIDLNSKNYDIARKIRWHFFVAKEIINYDNNSFIFFESEITSYDACVGYDWEKDEVYFVGSYYDSYGVRGLKRSIVPII